MKLLPGKSQIPLSFVLSVGLLAGTSCAASAPETVIQMATVVNTVVQTVEVTRLVPATPKLQTVEVTRLVEVPVTLTETPTPIYTPTRTATPTQTPLPTWTRPYEPPLIKVKVHSACMYGPGVGYLYKYDIEAGAYMEVIGWREILSKDLKGNWGPMIWIYIKAIGGISPCWIESDLTEMARGNLYDAPEYFTLLPASQLYKPVPGATANREGNIVTVFISSIWMTEDDYRGYLVEAWVCWHGNTYFAPVGWKDANVPMPALAIPDEPGCREPSSGKVYAVEKHGYTAFVTLKWPQAQ